MKSKLLTLFIFTFSLVNAQINVNVDFSKGIDNPLSKSKVGGLYQTPWISSDWIERDIPKISELESRSMRYEIAWGQEVMVTKWLQKMKMEV